METGGGAAENRVRRDRLRECVHLVPVFHPFPATVSRLEKAEGSPRERIWASGMQQFNFKGWACMLTNAWLGQPQKPVWSRPNHNHDKSHAHVLSQPRRPPGALSTHNTIIPKSPYT
uniref:Uncharacterized protein n=1 Tax=Oryza glumipatula TaxID=40148 RepID=A0A0D9YF21_9ORYZ